MGNRRWIIAIAVILLTCIFPFASVRAKKVEKIETDVVICSNPIYGETFTENDFPSPDSFGISLFTAEPDYEKYPASLEEAGAVLREQLKERAEVSAVYFQCGDDVELGNLIGEIWDESMKHTGDPREGDYLNWQWGGYSATVTGKGMGSTRYLTIIYTVIFYTDYSQEEQVDTDVEDLMNTLDLSGCDYERFMEIYGWICANVTYDYANLENNEYKLKHTAYAALEDGTSVCQGYALLLYRMLLTSGIDNRIIVSTNHAWNIVKIGSKYYNVDATWDAGKKRNQCTDYWYCLKGSGFDKDHPRKEEYTTEEFQSQYPTSEVDYRLYLGDVNGDGEVNNLDRLYLARHLANWDDYGRNVIHLALCDVNKDGTVNNLDRLILSRHLAKWPGYEMLPYAN